MDTLTQSTQSDFPTCQSRWTRTVHEEIARQHTALLYRAALQFTANDSDAHDLVQDTFETSLRKLPKELPEDRIGSWLTVTLRNRFIDLHRAAKSHRKTALLDTGLFALPTQETAEEPRWATVGPERLWDCVTRLKVSLREVFLLRARDGRSYAEIAFELSIPSSTVGTRYHRALRCLRRMLESEVVGHAEQIVGLCFAPVRTRQASERAVSLP